MESLPTASLVVIEAAFLFGIFVKLLNDKAGMSQQNQTRERGVLGQHAEPVFDRLFFLLLWLNRSGLRVISQRFWHRAFGQEPALRSRVDATVAGAVQRGASGPVDAQGHSLNLHRPLGSLSPPDGLPGRDGQGLDQFFDGIQRSWAGFARLTAPAVDRRLGGSRLNLVGQTAAEGALHRTHIRDSTLVESSRDALGLSP